MSSSMPEAENTLTVWDARAAVRAALAVPCPVCPAVRDRPCWTEGDVNPAVHPERRLAAAEALAACPPWCLSYGLPAAEHDVAGQGGGAAVHTPGVEATQDLANDGGNVWVSLIYTEGQSDRTYVNIGGDQVLGVGEQLFGMIAVTPDAAEALADLAPQLRRYAAWARANTAEAPVEVTA